MAAASAVARARAPRRAARRRRGPSAAAARSRAPRRRAGDILPGAPARPLHRAGLAGIHLQVVVARRVRIPVARRRLARAREDRVRQDRQPADLRRGLLCIRRQSRHCGLSELASLAAERTWWRWCGRLVRSERSRPSSRSTATPSPSEMPRSATWRWIRCHVFAMQLYNLPSRSLLPTQTGLLYPCVRWPGGFGLARVETRESSIAHDGAARQSGLLLEAAAAPAGHLEGLAAKQLTIQHDLMRAHAEVFSLHGGALAIIVERMQAASSDGRARSPRQLEADGIPVRPRLRWKRSPQTRRRLARCTAFARCTAPPLRLWLQQRLPQQQHLPRLLLWLLHHHLLPLLPPALPLPPSPAAEDAPAAAPSSRSHRTAARRGARDAARGRPAAGRSHPRALRRPHARHRPALRAAARRRRGRRRGGAHVAGGGARRVRARQRRAGACRRHRRGGRRLLRRRSPPRGGQRAAASRRSGAGEPPPCGRAPPRSTAAAAGGRCRGGRRLALAEPISRELAPLPEGRRRAGSTRARRTRRARRRSRRRRRATASARPRRRHSARSATAWARSRAGRRRRHRRSSVRSARRSRRYGGRWRRPRSAAAAAAARAIPAAAAAAARRRRTWMRSRSCRSRSTICSRKSRASTLRYGGSRAWRPTAAAAARLAATARSTAAVERRRRRAGRGAGSSGGFVVDAGGAA